MPEPQDDEVHDRNSPAIRDRRQPLEREVRIVLTREECLEGGGRPELEGVRPGGSAEPDSGTRRPNAESANRVDSDRRRMPTVRRQPSG